MDNDTRNKRIELVFPEPEGVRELFTKEVKLERAVTTIQGLINILKINILKDYKVSSIEIWVQGAVESGGVIKLFISAKGEGGVKITLTPSS